jgi:hypothetical protein
MMPKQPVVKFRLGYVTATIWQNGEHYNTVLSKRYKDGDDWKDTVRVPESPEDFISSQV